MGCPVIALASGGGGDFAELADQMPVPVRSRDVVDELAIRMQSPRPPVNRERWRDVPAPDTSSVMAGHGYVPMRSQRTGLLVSQLCSSASNFLLTALGARLLAREDFGYLVAVLSLMFMAQAFQRAMVVDSLLVFGQTRPRLFREGSFAVPYSSMIAIVVIFAVSTYLHNTEVGIVVCLATVLLLVQDYLRYCAIASGATWSAAFADAGWLAVQALSTVLILIAGEAGYFWTAAPYLVGAFTGIAALKRVASTAMPVTMRPLAFFSHTKTLSAWAVPQFIVGSGLGQLLPTALIATIGASELASLRATQLVFMPFATVLPALGASYTLRLTRTPSSRQVRETVRASAGWLAVALAAAAVVIALGGSVLASLFGGEYRPGRALLSLVALTTVTQFALVPSGALMRAKAMGRNVFLSQALPGVLGFVFCILATGVWPSNSVAAACIAAQTICVGVVSVFLLTREQRVKEPV